MSTSDPADLRIPQTVRGTADLEQVMLRTANVLTVAVRNVRTLRTDLRATVAAGLRAEGFGIAESEAWAADLAEPLYRLAESFDQALAAAVDEQGRVRYLHDRRREIGGSQ